MFLSENLRKTDNWTFIKLKNKGSVYEQEKKMIVEHFNSIIALTIISCQHI